MMEGSPVIDRSVIRPIAICVFRRGGQVLVGEGYDAVKEEVFHRPIGGALRFGETSEAAMRREIDEELGVEVQGLRLLGVLENIFTCDGQRAHEIVFVYEAELCDEALYRRPLLRGMESHGEAFAAVWRDIGPGGDDAPPLYPDGLVELLIGRADELGG